MVERLSEQTALALIEAINRLHTAVTRIEWSVNRVNGNGQIGPNTWTCRPNDSVTVHYLPPTTPKDKP